MQPKPVGGSRSCFHSQLVGIGKGTSSGEQLRNTGVLISPTRKETSYSDRRFRFSYILFTIVIGGMLVLFIYTTRLASNEIFSPSNKIHREVGRAKDLSAPLYLLAVTGLVNWSSFMLVINSIARQNTLYIPQLNSLPWKARPNLLHAAVKKFVWEQK